MAGDKDRLPGPQAAFVAWLTRSVIGTLFISTLVLRTAVERDIYIGWGLRVPVNWKNIYIYIYIYIYLQRPKGPQPRGPEAHEHVLSALLRSWGNEKEHGRASPDSLEWDKVRFSHPHPHWDGALPGFLLSPGSSCSGQAFARPSSFSCPPTLHPASLSPGCSPSCWDLLSDRHCADRLTHAISSSWFHYKNVKTYRKLEKVITHTFVTH